MNGDGQAEFISSAGFLFTPAIPQALLPASATTVVDRTSDAITTATAGVREIESLLRQKINAALISFYKSGATDGDTATIEIYAGRADGLPFKAVYKGTITIGPAIIETDLSGDAITDGLYADTITSDGNDYWGASIIGNACDDIAQLQFDLRGCRYLYVVISDTDVKAIVSGY